MSDYNTENFWFSQPNVLFQSEYFRKIFPDETDTLAGKLNALTRLIILISFMNMIIFPQKRLKLLITCIIVLGGVIIFERNLVKEGFTNSNTEQKCFAMENPKMPKIQPVETTKPSKNNPFMNILPNEIKDNPKRQVADTDAYANNSIKHTIQSNLDSNLFKSLSDEIDYENFEKRFNVMPVTSILNAQESFINYCYNNTAYDKDKSFLNPEKKKII